MEFTIPQSLRAEHEELHAELVKGTKESGMVGEAAEAVARVLHPHFLKEEEYALPPLGLLSTLAKGTATTDMEPALKMTNRLRDDLAQMLAEHKAIVAQLERLTDAARKERKTAYVRFSEKLVLHAQMEEEVLYPAAILIGEHLRLKKNRKALALASEVIAGSKL
jgi:hemerythrin superfamily protein